MSAPNAPGPISARRPSPPRPVASAVMNPVTGGGASNHAAVVPSFPRCTVIAPGSSSNRTGPVPSPRATSVTDPSCPAAATKRAVATGVPSAAARTVSAAREALPGCSRSITTSPASRRVAWSAADGVVDQVPIVGDPSREQRTTSHALPSS